MDFHWTKEQKELKKKAIEFARSSNLPDIVELDRNSEFPRSQWRAYAEYGTHGLTVPVKYGGQDLDLLSCVAVLEGLGYGSNDSGILLSIIAHIFSCIEPLMEFGSQKQQDKYLPRLASGELVGLHAITEPGSGSDALQNMKTTSIDKGDHYLVNGGKTYITNGDIADLLIILLKIKESSGKDKLSCILLEKETPGFSTRKIEKMGFRTCPFAELIFENCIVPKENLLGDVGDGRNIFYHMIFKERAIVMAANIGLMEQQLDRCVKYAKDRKQFGKPIIEFDSITNLLADMKTGLEISRLLVYKAAWLIDQGRNDSQFSSLAKLFVSECCVKNSISAMKIHGGSGYTTDLDVERQLRDSFGGIFTSGTSEIMRKIIAGLL